jgi:hypothetical protein
MHQAADANSHRNPLLRDPSFRIMKHERHLVSRSWIHPGIGQLAHVGYIST